MGDADRALGGWDNSLRFVHGRAYQLIVLCKMTVDVLECENSIVWYGLHISHHLPISPSRPQSQVTRERELAFPSIPVASLFGTSYFRILSLALPPSASPTWVRFFLAFFASLPHRIASHIQSPNTHAY